MGVRIIHRINDAWNTPVVISGIKPTKFLEHERAIHAETIMQGDKANASHKLQRFNRNRPKPAIMQKVDRRMIANN